METPASIENLRREGRITWLAQQRAWLAVPDVVLEALRVEGFSEVKHEVTRRGHGRTPFGGVWQGLDPRTGSVASAVWVHTADDPAVVFIDIDGAPGGRDAAVMIVSHPRP
jgi:hypothetical protein